MIPLHELSIAGSLAALAVGWEVARRHAISPQKTSASLVGWASVIALVVTLGDLVVEAIARRAFPLETLADALLWFSLTPIAAVLAVRLVAKNVWPALLLLPLAMVAQLASLFFREWFVGDASRQALGDVLLALHVGLFLVGYGAFIVSGALAVVYLGLDRRLKRRGMADLWSEEMPPLGKIDRLISATAGLGVILWGLGLGLGMALFSRELPHLGKLGSGTFYTDLTVLTSFGVWIYFLTFTALRGRVGWVGKRASFIVLFGVALILASYAGGKLQSRGGLHGFSAAPAMAEEVPR